jgi:hypothetical protein
LVGKPYRQKEHGSYRHRWEDVEMDFKGIICEVWAETKLGQKRAQLGSLLSTVVNNSVIWNIKL